MQAFKIIAGTAALALLAACGSEEVTRASGGFELGVSANAQAQNTFDLGDYATALNDSLGKLGALSEQAPAQDGLAAFTGKSKSRNLSDTLHDAMVQLDDLRIMLPPTLASQDNELAYLAQTNPAAHKIYLESVRAERQAMIDALSRAEARAVAAAEALRTRAAGVDADYSQHLAGMAQIAASAAAARNEVTLF